MKKWIVTFVFIGLVCNAVPASLLWRRQKRSGCSSSSSTVSGQWPQQSTGRTRVRSAHTEQEKVRAGKDMQFKFTGKIQKENSHKQQFHDVDLQSRDVVKANLMLLIMQSQSVAT